MLSRVLPLLALLLGLSARSDAHLNRSLDACPTGADCSATTAYSFALPAAVGYWQDDSGQYLTCDAAEHCPTVGNACSPDRTGPRCSICLTGGRPDPAGNCSASTALYVIPLALLGIISVPFATANAFRNDSPFHLAVIRVAIASVQMIGAMGTLVGESLPSGVAPLIVAIESLAGSPRVVSLVWSSEPWITFLVYSALPVALIGTILATLTVPSLAQWADRQKTVHLTYLLGASSMTLLIARGRTE